MAGGPIARAELRLRCVSAEEARVLWEAVRVDDPGSVEGRVQGEDLVVTAGPLAATSLRVTLDDLLACLQAARLDAFGTAPGTGGEVD